MSKKDNLIYPTTDAPEIRANAKKNNLGIFVKQYKKDNFIYTITKIPFRRETIACLHIPTQKVFGYSPIWLEWFSMGCWNDFI